MSLTIHRPPEDLLTVALELGFPAERATRRRSRLLVMLGAACATLVPWIFYLGFSMPTGYRTKAWSAAWVGFDVLLLAALLGTALGALFRRKIAIPLAMVTATLLICDAWFDIALDWGTSDVWGSIASAVFLELPLAAFLLNWVRSLIRIMLTLRWRELGLPGDPPGLHRLPLLATPTAWPNADQGLGQQLLPLSAQTTLPAQAAVSIQAALPAEAALPAQAALPALPTAQIPNRRLCTDSGGTSLR